MRNVRDVAWGSGAGDALGELFGLPPQETDRSLETTTSLLSSEQLNSFSTSGANFRSMPSLSSFQPGPGRSLLEFSEIFGTVPITTLAGGGCVSRPSEVAWREPGLLESDALGVMVSSGYGYDVSFASGFRRGLKKQLSNSSSKQR